MKKFNQLCIVFFFLAIMTPTAIMAQEGSSGKWYFEPSAFFFDLQEASTNTNIAGGDLPGENVSFTNSLVPGVGIGYFISKNISIHTVIALPPTATAEGQNNLAGLKAADVTYAPFALTGLYHFQFGAFEPFIGGGISYAMILKEEDIDVANVEADNAFGFILRGGLNYMFSDTWGINVSVNKLFIDTDITGEAGPDPVAVDVSLDPWVYSLGVVYRL